MKIVYTEGPAKVTMGAAGVFRRGEPKDVPDELAERLLAKKSINFEPAEPPAGGRKRKE